MLSKAKEPCSQPMELVVSSELRDTLYVHMYLAGKRSMLQVEGFGSNQTVKPRLNNLNGSVHFEPFSNFRFERFETAVQTVSRFRIDTHDIFLKYFLFSILSLNLIFFSCFWDVTCPP